MPDMQWQFLAQQSPWVLIGLVFLISLAESLAIVGIIVPGVVLLAGLSGMASWLGLNVYFLLCSAFLGALTGDVCSFYLGRLGKERFWHFQVIQKYQSWLVSGVEFFERWGWASVFIGRFVGPVRPVLPLVAGLFSMPALRFLMIDFFACVLWAPVYILPGFYVGHWIGDLDTGFKAEHWMILGAVVFISLCWLFFRRLMVRR